MYPLQQDWCVPLLDHPSTLTVRRMSTLAGRMEKKNALLLLTPDNTATTRSIMTKSNPNFSLPECQNAYQVHTQPKRPRHETTKI